MIRLNAVWRPALALAVLALASCASQGPSLPPPPTHANGQVLWRIVHDQCVPDQLAKANPAPCALVSPAGFVVLKDRDGVSQYLVMPTAKVTGIEDPAVLAPGAVNYFAAAWGQRHYVDDRLGRTLDRTQVSVAVNSIYGRSQDQLHLHVDCLDGAVGSALARLAASPGARWRPIRLKGHAYLARWLADDGLAATNPFTLLAATVPGARRSMGAWTLALVGARGPGGAPGFYILANRVDVAAGDWGSAEELQDHACRT